jgi:hypothetical protein
MSGRGKSVMGIEFTNIWGTMDSLAHALMSPPQLMRQCKTDSERVLAEDRLELLRDGVRLMVKQFSDGAEYADVVEAYDAGLSSGFFMKSSAIAQGFRQNTARRFVDVRRQHRRAYAISLRKIYAVGFQQGRLLALGLCDE